MNIVIAGTGYEGLVLGVCFAEMGHKVTCVDIDVNKIKMLQSGLSPIYEADLERLMQKNHQTDRLDYTTDETVYKDADVIFVDVGAVRLPDGSSDTSNIFALVNKIVMTVEKDSLIVIKSTVPVGTCDKIEQMIKECLTGSIRIEVASNPDLFSKGTAIRDTLQASGIVIGTQSEWAEEILRQVYEPFGRPIISISRKSAEMLKFALNNFLAMRISFMNDIANLCELAGADVKEVALGLSFDSRVGFKSLDAGIGYGGPSLSEDVKTLDYIAGQYDYELKTVKAAIEVNNKQRTGLYEKALSSFKSFNKLKVAVLGLTYKPGTDDCREAPSIYFISKLLEEGAEVYAYDPVGIDNFKRLFKADNQYTGSVNYTENIEEALDDAELCFILTEWGKVKSIKPEIYHVFMKTPVVYDGRNIYNPEDMRKAGVEYHSIGRAPVRFNQSDRIFDHIDNEFIEV